MDRTGRIILPDPLLKLSYGSGEMGGGHVQKNNSGVVVGLDVHKLSFRRASHPGFRFCRDACLQGVWTSCTKLQPDREAGQLLSERLHILPGRVLRDLPPQLL